MLTGAGSSLAGLAIGLGVAGRATPTPPDPGVPTGPALVEATGAHQAGIDRPATPQTFCMLAVFDVPTEPTATTIREIGAALGTAVTTATSPEHAIDAGLLDGPGDLTVTVGAGPRLVAAVDRALPGATDLPAFAGDESIPAERRGGDVAVLACSSDANDAATALAHVAASLPELRLRWMQRGFRARGTGTIARNPLGYHDGVIVPRGEAQLAEHVWVPDGPAAGGSILVVRRLRLDTTGFDALPGERQDQVIGRRRADGVPLSGGELTSEADLLAKTPEGQLLVPATSHVRAAHPSFTGSHLMLRRGYAFDDGTALDHTGSEVHDAGLLFMCFQRDLDTFVRTQHRLDEADDLMQYATPTGSGTFLVLPGFDGGRALGTTLAGS